MPTCFYNALRIFGGIMGVMGLVIICVQMLSECRDKQFCGRDRPPYLGIACVLLGLLAFGSSFALLWCRGKKEHELRVEDKVEPKVHYTRASPGYNTESARQSVDNTPCNTPNFLPPEGRLDAKILCEKLDCVAMERASRNEDCSAEVDHPVLSLKSFQQHSPLTSTHHRPDDMDSLRKIRQDYSVVDETAIQRLPRTQSVSSNVSKMFKKPVGTASSSRKSSLTGSQRYCHSLVPYSGSSESLYSEEEDCNERDGSKPQLITADIYTEERSRRGYFFFPAARKEARRDTWGNRGTFKRTPAFYNRWEQSERSPELVQLYSSAEDIHVPSVRTDDHYMAHMESPQNNRLSKNPSWSTCTSFEQLEISNEYETSLDRDRDDQECRCEVCRIDYIQTAAVESDGYSTDEERSDFGDSESQIRLSPPRSSTVERPKTPFVGRAKHGWFFSSDEEYVPSGKSASDRDSPSNRNTNKSAQEDLTSGRKNKMVAAKMTDKGQRNVEELSRRTRSNSMGTSRISQTEKQYIDPETTFAFQRTKSRSLASKQVKYDSTAAKTKRARPGVKPGSPNRLVRQSSMRVVSSAEEHSNRGSMLNVPSDSTHLSVPAPVYQMKGPKRPERSDGRSPRTKDAKPQPKSLDSAASTSRRTAGHLCSNRSLYSSCPDLGCSTLSLHNLAETARDKFGADEGNGEKLFKLSKHVEEWCARYLPEGVTKKQQEDSTDPTKTKTEPRVNKSPPKDVVDAGIANKTNDKVDHRNDVERNPVKQSGQRKLPEQSRVLDVDKQKNSERSTRRSNPGTPSPRSKLKRSSSHHRNSGHGNTLKANSIHREQSGGSTQRLYEHKRTGDETDGRRSHRTHVHVKDSSTRSARSSKNGPNHSYSKDKPRNKEGTFYDGDVDTSNGHRHELLSKQNVGEHGRGRIRQAVERHRERAHHMKDRIDSTAHQMVDRHKERAHHIKDRIDSSTQHIADRHKERRHHIKDRIESKRERAHSLVGRQKERAHQLKDRVKGQSGGTKGRNNRANSQPTNSLHSNKQKRNMVRRNTTGTTPSLLSSRPGGLGGSSRLGGGPSLMNRLAPSPLTILTASSSSLQLLQKTLAS
ncbi:Hypp318 [Branchiostoma lanceolatum]|uniref:Hypp318 protein n=2 Tax=Branchiostoma lanceolatum TaxID=7740 RepID=A0A8J9YKC8_BRALA|nr:Hypp318 [Branchiostoma lanceolatum]